MSLPWSPPLEYVYGEWVGKLWPLQLKLDERYPNDAAFQINKDSKLQVCFIAPFFTKLHTCIFQIVVHNPVITDGSILQSYCGQIPNSKWQHLKCLQNNGPHTHYNAEQDGMKLVTENKHGSGPSFREILLDSVVFTYSCDYR